MLDFGTTRALTWPIAAEDITDGMQFVDVFFWFGVAAVLGLVGFYVIRSLRRWISREQPIQTFTIQDLREMRDRGDITDQEFVTMRARLLAQVRARSPIDDSDETVRRDETGP